MMDRFVTALLDHILNLKPDTVISLSAEIHSNDTDPLSEITCVEEIALGIRKRQAFPLLEYTTSNLRRRFFEELPSHIITQKPSYFDAMNAIIDIYMEIGWESLAEMEIQPDQAKAAVASNSGRQVIEEILQRQKLLLLLNYPTPPLAKKIGVEFHALKEHYLDAVCTNYGLLNIRTEDCTKELFTARDYQLTTDLGELSFSLMRDKLTRSAARVQQEQVIVLPSGYVTCPAVRSSIHGELLADRLYYMGSVYQDVKLRFDQGSIRFVTTANGENVNYDLHSALSSSNDTCFVMYGCNRNNTQFSGYALYDRCMDDSIMLRFYDINNHPIDIASQRGKLKKIKI